MTRRLIALFCVIAVVFTVTVRGADTPPVKPLENKSKGAAADDVDPKVRIEEAASQQERLRRQYEEFKQALLRLKQRLESSAKQEDKDKARVLNEALTRASEQGTDTKFSTLVAALKASESFKDLDQLQGILEKNDDLRKDIRMLIELLLKDDRDAELRRQREEYARLLEQLKEVIAKQEKVRTQTEMARKSAEELEKVQKKVTEDTKGLLGKKDSKGKAGNKSKKSDGKDSKDGKDNKDGKSGDGKDKKPSDGKSGDPKSGKDGKPSDGKDKKPSDGKSGDPKDGSPKPPSDSQGEPSDSQPKGNQPQSEDQQFKKKIQDANKSQEGAEKEIQKKKNPDAVTKQDEALNELKKAQKQLEQLLKQIREEENERLLAAIQARCERMLAMQIAVRDGTVGLDKAIDKKEATREQQQVSNELSDKEEEIIREASKAISIVQAEGSAIAFAEVFIQVRGDMTTVAGRLRKTDTGVVTVTVENDVIATLQEMIAALKKARKDNQNKSQQPPPPPNGGPPPDQKLIDTIAELKMIRSMQLRVNARTEVYGKQYEGEQAPSPLSVTDAKAREQYEMIQRELRDLAERQQKIAKVTGDISKGKNKGN